MTLVYGWDAIRTDLGSVPAGQGAGYTTGSGDVPWTPADFAAHPGAVRICQDAGATDDTADILDVETDAATVADMPGWLQRARHSFQTGARPGQRNPGFYMSISTAPDASTTLADAGYTSGVPLWLAHPGLTMDQAGELIGTTTGIFVIVGIQFAFRGAYDSDVWDGGWLADVSAGTGPPPSPPPATTTEALVASLPELARGATGPAVRTLQGLLAAREFLLGTTGPLRDGIDGDFGQLTDNAVRAFQSEQRISVDGIVGPQTWPLLPLV